MTEQHEQRNLVSWSPEEVKVIEFQNRIANVEQLVNCSITLPKTPDERTQLVRATQRALFELIGTTCRFATAKDLSRRETVINRAAVFISQHIVL